MRAKGASSSAAERPALQPPEPVAVGVGAVPVTVIGTVKVSRAESVVGPKEPLPACSKSVAFNVRETLSSALPEVSPLTVTSFEVYDTEAMLVADISALMIS